jgi:hypothetical protein
VELRRKGGLGLPLLAVEGRLDGRQAEAVVGFSAGDHLVIVPVFPLPAGEGGDVDYG